MSDTSFAIRRDALAEYKRVICLISTAILPGWILLRLGLDKALRKWADSLVYRLDGDCLSVSGSFVLWGLMLYRLESRIPLARITDLKLVQGPILNRMDLWTLYVQTASSGLQRPEAVLYALEQPHEVRDQILQAITRVRGG